MSNLPDELAGLTPITTPYGHLDKIINENWRKVEHLRRILYFIQNPQEIQNIFIDNEVLDGYILPIAKVTDGNHRIMTALYLDLDYIWCEYRGEWMY